LNGSCAKTLAHFEAAGEGWHPPHLESIARLSDDPLVSLPAVPAR
jgi:hypothetical protein